MSYVEKLCFIEAKNTHWDLKILWHL